MITVQSGISRVQVKTVDQSRMILPLFAVARNLSSPVIRTNDMHLIDLFQASFYQPTTEIFAVGYLLTKIAQKLRDQHVEG